MSKLIEKLNLKPWWLWLFFYIFIFAWLLNNSFGYLDNDYGWHLKFGQDIWTSKQLPTAQIHMWPLAGQNWVDHEWLGNLLTFGLNSWGGYPLVNIFYALIIVIILIWLAIEIKQKKKQGDLLIMAWQTLGILAICGHLGVRVQELGLCFFTIFLILLNKFWDQENLTKLNLILLPLFWLWACCHASFIIGFIILWLYIICRLIVKKKKIKINDLVLAISPILITFITPYGLKLYDLLFEYRNTAYMSQISEWLPITSFPIHYFKLLFLAIFFALVLNMWITARAKIFKAQNLFTWLLLGLLVCFSCNSIRHFQLLFIASHIFLLPLLIKEDDSRQNIINSGWIKFFITAVLINLIAWQLININFVNQPFDSYGANFPIGASKFLKNNSSLKNLKLLNYYDWGGYLIYTLPDWQLFIDGRLPQKLYHGRTMIEVFSDFKKQELIPSKLIEENIQLVIWPTKQRYYHLNFLDKYFGFTDQQINSPRNFVQYYLVTNPDWEKVYSDKTAEIYVLKSALK